MTREEVTKAEEESKSSTSIHNQSSSTSLLLTGQSRRLPNRESLVEYREISPRREEDRLYGQAEMKRYKETKEKFKQRKEMLKRRKLDKLMRAGLIGGDSDKRVSFRSIQITDDELYDETDDEQEREGEALLNGADYSHVDSTIAIPLMEKIVLGNSRVDELDEPHKYNEMTRLKVRERNSKRSRALKVQMKLKKMKMDEEHGEGDEVAVNGQSHLLAEGLLLGLSPVTTTTTNGAGATTSGGTPLSSGLTTTAGGSASGSASSMSSDRARRIKDKFRANIAGVIVQHLSPYRRDSCPVGRITTNDDFKHLAKKVSGGIYQLGNLFI